MTSTHSDTDPTTLEALLKGELVTAGDPGYDEARRVFNGAVDRRPLAVARCADVSDVVESMVFASSAGVPVAVRGGGHSVAGHGTCDGGLVVDLRAMRGVRVDAATRVATVDAGATLGELDGITQLCGLATPTGQVSATGIAGLTLSGGMGMLQRRFGLTCDNLLAADVVTADGERIRVSDDSHPDLFWALRGGGGNFGVVTSFEFRLHEVGPQVLAGLIAYPVEDTTATLRLLSDVIAVAPRELSADAIVQRIPPLPAFPDELRGRLVTGIFIRWSGDLDRGQKVIEPLRRHGRPVLDFVGPMSYPEVQSMLDPLNPPGNLHYWTGEFVGRMGPAESAVIADAAAELPTPQSIVQVIPFNGAVTDIDPDATAFAHRQDSWLIHALGQCHEPGDFDRVRDWARALGARLRKLGTGAAYFNLLTDDEGDDRVRAFWNDSRLSRLARVKATYDPDNVLRFNHNIPLEVAIR